MTPKAILHMAKPFKATIGAHVPLIGNSNVTHDDYQRARAESDAAVQRAKYLIQHLANRHDAVLFARAVGMPGYINMR
jgi:hypothetical protein